MAVALDLLAWLPTSDTALDDAAIAYAEHGFLVLPVYGVRSDGSCGCEKPDCGKSAGKHPVGARWQQRATSDIDEVIEERRRCVGANIGLKMGGPMRLVAVDVDGSEGRESWDAIAEGREAVTLTSSTGRSDGGEHRVYSLPEGWPMPTNSSRVNKWAGLDVRAENGQIVAAPSIHRTGARYQWTQRVPVAQMPRWLYDALVAVPVSAPLDRVAAPVTESDRDAYVAKALANACEAIARGQSGERNTKLFAKACTVLEYYVGESLGLEYPRRELEHAGIACGLSAAEASNAVRNAAEKAASGGGKRVPSKVVHLAPIPAVLQTPAQALDLSCDGKGKPKNTLGNVMSILALHEGWRGVLVYDLLAEAAVLVKAPPVRLQDAEVGAFAVREWTDIDSVRTAAWIEWTFGFPCKPSMIDEALLAVARRHCVHPIRDYLKGLRWDGIPRLDAWLITHYGASDTPYVRGVGSRWMISAVARSFRPGCQADCTLVLESAMQGEGKSSGLRALASPAWFSDTGLIIGEKDSYQSLRRKWIYELAELGSLKGKDIEKTKNFLSAPSDNYRPSYARRNVDFPRQNVFAGTTNESTYLADKTGNRRFWPVKVGKCDVTALTEARDQLWAEAYARFEGGEEWHVNTEEFAALCKEQQEERVYEDPWETVVSRWLLAPTVTTPALGGGFPNVRKIDLTQGVSITDVLMGALTKPVGQISKADQMRAAEAMKALGWERRKIRSGNESHWKWVVPSVPAFPPVLNLSKEPIQPAKYSMDLSTEKGGNSGNSKNILPNNTVPSSVPTLAYGGGQVGTGDTLDLQVPIGTDKAVPTSSGGCFADLLEGGGQ